MAPHTVRTRADASEHSYPYFVDRTADLLQESQGCLRFQNRRMAERPGTIREVRILVLGIGNLFLTDGGVGARVVEALQREFEFSENVELMHDWTLGFGLLDTVIGVDALISVGAVRAGRPPGMLHRFVDGELNRALMRGGSPHEAALAETLAAAEILGRKPETVVLGMEPEDTASQSTWLTETVELRMPELLDATLREVKRMGGAYRPRDSRTRPQAARETAVV